MASCDKDRPFAPRQYLRQNRQHRQTILDELKNDGKRRNPEGLEHHWRQYGRDRGYIGCHNCCPGDALLDGESPAAVSSNVGPSDNTTGNTAQQQQQAVLAQQARDRAAQQRMLQQAARLRRQQRQAARDARVAAAQAAAEEAQMAPEPFTNSTSAQLSDLDSKYGGIVSDIERNLYGSDLQQGTHDDIRAIADRNSFLLEDPGTGGLAAQVNMLSSQVAANKAVLTDHRNDISTLYSYH